MFVDLSNALSDTGIEINTICRSGSEAAQMLKKNGKLSVQEIPVLGSWDFLAQFRIKRLVDFIRPDIIHCHMARAAHLAGKACRHRNIPLVANLHNYIDLKYYRHITHFIAATPDQKDYLLQNNIKDNLISVIPHFTALNPVTEINRRQNRPPILIAYGRMAHVKGFDVLIEACRVIQDSGKDFKLYLGGDGPESKNLEILARRLNLQHRIDFCGWINDVEKFLASGDIYVLPSRSEAFGLTILEAMSSGKPIVTTKTRGPTQILDDKIAYLAETEDADDLASKILFAISNEQDRYQKAENGLKKFKGEYDKNVVMKKFLSMYESL